MTKSIKEVIERVADGERGWIHDQLAGTSFFAGGLKEVDDEVDQALKEIEAIHQQEIAKARIEEVEMFSAGVAPGKYMAPHWYAEDRIKELSQTLKELKEAEL